MERRDYYSARTGKIAGDGRIDFNLLKRLFRILYEKYDAQGYFQKHFGYYCIDGGDIPGSLGADLETTVYMLVRKDDLWPFRTKLESYEEADLFTMIEFLYDHVSKPLDGYHHTYNDCGMHYSTFDDQEGREQFRLEINHLLKDYGTGYEVSLAGEILNVAEPGFATLLEATIPTNDETNIKERVEAAKLKFRLQKSSWDQRGDAIRDLASVLEFVRDEAKKHLSRADEADLFNLANNFGIRHHNATQKTTYDKSIWYPWMFYYYLATIHALLRFIDKAEQPIIESTK